MKKVKINEKEYEVIENYKDGFELDVVKDYVTEYFDNYDYIFGDWSYGKLRLKGFCDSNNKIKNKINDYSNIKNYIKKYCAYECRYFIIKKVVDTK